MPALARCDLCVWLVVALVVQPRAIAAQQLGVRGRTNAPAITRVTPPVPAPPSIPPDSVSYRKMSAADRWRLVQWWASAPAPADHTVVFSVLNEALQEADTKIRLAAVIVVRRLAGEANAVEPVAGLPEVTQQVRSAVTRLIGTDPDASVRRESVSAVILFSHPFKKDVSDVIFQRLTAEPDDRVRARLVIAIGEIGRQGSDQAASALVGSLSDSSAEVRAEATAAVGRLKIAAGLPKVAAELTAKEPWLRAAAADALGKFGTNAAKYRNEIERALDGERDPLIRQKLKTLLAGIGG